LRAVWIVAALGHQHADAAHALGLLRMRRERPNRSRAPDWI